MSRLVWVVIVSLFGWFTSSLLLAASPPPALDQPELIWTRLAELPEPLRRAPTWVEPKAGQLVEVDFARLRGLLATVPLDTREPVRASGVVISLPRPDGGFERFAIVESPVMEPGLQAQLPELRSYLGQGIDRPAATVRFDLSPLGLRAQVLDAPSGPHNHTAAWLIEPAIGGNTRYLVSYFRGAAAAPGEFACSTPQLDAKSLEIGLRISQERQEAEQESAPLEVLRNEFGIAVQTTGEFSVGVGNRMSPPQSPTLSLIMGVIQTTIGRVNQILERDGPVRLLLITNNPAIVYLDPNTDPFDTTKPDSELQANFQDNINAVLGTTTYSFGHTFHWTAGSPRGNAGGIGVVCNDSKKALGFSATNKEFGDYFAVDYVAHEIGHQLGATHTFNGIAGACGAQRTASSAYEPGSGSTIMGYGGICDSDNIVSVPPDPPPPPLPPTANGASVPMYNLSSMIQIANHVTGVTCVTRIPTGNVHPGATPSAQGPYYVPSDTPFRLIGPSAEFGGPQDALTYSIEQFDLGPQWPLGQDSGQHEPLFRVLAPSTVNERKFPRFEYVLNGTPSRGENLPRFSRSSDFRGVLRDNVAGAGGWSWGDIDVEVVEVPLPGFRVTAPSGGGAYCGGTPMGVTWNVANTNEAPINAATVDILMSTDNGQNFPWTLAADFPNAGAALVPPPAVPTTEARIMVQSSGGLFFHVNSGPFEVASGPPTIAQQPVGQALCPNGFLQLSFTPGPGSPRHIQWYKDNVAISGATSETYEKFLAQNNDSGDYKVVITNACGSVTSNTVRVQVGVTFDQTAPPATPQACQDVSISSYARGVGALNHQWLKDDQPLVGDGRIVGVAAPTLTLGAVRYEDEAFYRARVQDQCETRLTDPVKVTLPTPAWTHRTTSGPIRRGGTTDLVFDASRQVSVLYGGVHPDGQMLGDTWEWDGVLWRQRAPAVTPGPRNGSELVYDSKRQHVLLFGGYALAPHPFNNSEVWSYAGGDWQLVSSSPDGPPPNVATHGDATFDSARGKMIVVVEGTNGSGPANRTWEFDSASSSWSLASTGPGPSYFLSPIAFDATNNQAVGQYYWNADNPLDAKSWTYTGSGWNPLGAATPARYYPAMSYDSVRRRVTLYSCCRNSGPGSYRTDTHAFDGTGWLEVLPDITTSQLDAVIPSGMTFDARRRAMVMVGSAYNDTYYSGIQTWEFRYRDRVMFDRDPAGAGAPAGGTVQFEAVADGAPALTYRWRRGTTELIDGPAPGGSIISGATTPTLTISSLSTADEGSYRLAATNACGQQLSAPAPLAIAGNGVGRVPGDAGSPGVPLSIARSGSDLKLTWGPSCRPTDTDYEVYEGSLGAFTSHSAKLCTTGGATSATFTPAGGLRYYLVVPTDGSSEGSYGIASNGVERPRGATTCRPQYFTTCP
jgi:hypothetical protein